MTKNKFESVLLLAPELEDLEGFVNNLNTEYYWHKSPLKGSQRVLKDFRPVQRELRRLAQAWFDSGPNVSKLFRAEPILAREAQSFRAEAIPTKHGTARIALSTTQGPTTGPLSNALGLFLEFLLNPYNVKLGGPCKYCGNYFAKKTLRKKSVFCTKDCGRRYTSRKANREKRQQERLKKLQLAKQSISEWSRAKTKEDWNEWVSRDPLISKNWLTRAEKSGELFVPIRPVQ